VITLGVIPVLVGPLQVLIAVLPAILIAVGTMVVALFKPATLKKLAKLLWRLKFQVAGLLILGAGLLWIGKWAVAKFAPTAGHLERDATDWPMVRGSLARTGAVPGTPEPSSGGVIWQYKKGNEAVFASPAVVGNRVFVSVADMGAFGQSGRLYAFDADTGSLAWTGVPPGYEPTFSSPVVSGDFLVCGEGLHWAKTARLVCLDVLTGKTLWMFRTKSHVECAPVIDGGRVYVGAGDDGYYCVDLKSGGEVWHAPGEKYEDAETALVVHAGKVYAGLGSGVLCVLDAATGKELSRLPMPYPVFAPPTIADGKLYLGMGKGDYVNPGKGGEVRCLDLATLKTDWTFPLEMTVLGSVVAKGDRIYFASRDQYVYCLGRDGKLRAKFNAQAPVSAAPAVTERYVYVVTEAGLLLGLKRDTLEPVWDFRIGTKPLFISAPTIARGHVYVGTQEDGLFCVGEPGKAVVAATDNDGSPLPESGTFLWQYPADQEGGSNRLVTGRCVAFGKDLYAPLATGNIRLIVGAEPKAEGVKGVPPIMEGPLEIRSEAGAIVALDRATQRPLWRVAAQGVTPGVIVRDRFYIGADKALECRSVLDGRLLGSWEAMPQPGVPPLVSRGRLLFAAKDALMVLNLEKENAAPVTWMDTSWLGPVYGPMVLKDSKVFVPVEGWGIVCLGAGK
jgi:outer membrane protein assembly factor BamB